MLGWGSTYGTILAAASARERGKKVATAHLVHLNPMPANTGEVEAVREGADPRDQHRAARDADPLRAPGRREDLSKVQGQPIFAEELEDEILRVVGGETGWTGQGMDG